MSIKIMSFSKIILFLFLISCKKEITLPDPLAAGWNNESVCELVEENDKLRVLKCTFDPGIGHEKHYHEPHFGYVLAGSKFRLSDKDGIKEVQVLTGSSFYSEGTEGHKALNIGDSTAVFLIMEPK
jgi:quercetin dioxygenase-like cupin family protein